MTNEELYERLTRWGSEQPLANRLSTVVIQPVVMHFRRFNMDSHLFVSLKDVVEKWLNDHCEDDEWPSFYVYENQSKDMAKAAELVFDASVKGQEFAENESY